MIVFQKWGSKLNEKFRQGEWRAIRDPGMRKTVNFADDCREQSHAGATQIRCNHIQKKQLRAFLCEPFPVDIGVPLAASLLATIHPGPVC